MSKHYQQDFGSVITSRTSFIDEIINLARKSSIWYLLFGLACCGIEMMQTGGPRADLDRFGIVPARHAAPERPDDRRGHGDLQDGRALPAALRADAGAQVRDRMGSCANCGGLFQYAYSVVKGVDKVIPVDIYVPGCPPRPEALTEGLLRLQEKIIARALVRPTARIWPGPRRALRRRLRGKRLTHDLRRDPAAARREVRRAHRAACPAEQGAVPRACRPATSLEICRFLKSEPGPRLRLPDEPLRRRLAEARTRSTSSTTSSPTRSGTVRAQGAARPRGSRRCRRVEGVWKAADWHEREAFDLLGVVFTGHPDLRRILLPDDWVGYPLRKDYKEQAE